MDIYDILINIFNYIFFEYDCAVCLSQNYDITIYPKIIFLLFKKFGIPSSIIGTYIGLKKSKKVDNRLYPTID